MVGPPSRDHVHTVSNESLLRENFLVKVVEADQEQEVSPCSNSYSVEKVPQTPLFVLESMCQGEDIEEEVVPNEEDLMETQVIWDLGKTFGL